MRRVTDGWMAAPLLLEMIPVSLKIIMAVPAKWQPRLIAYMISNGSAATIPARRIHDGTFIFVSRLGNRKCCPGFFLDSIGGFCDYKTHAPVHIFHFIFHNCRCGRSMPHFISLGR